MIYLSNHMNQQHIHKFLLESGEEITFYLLDKVSISPLVMFLADSDLYTFIEHFSDNIPAMTHKVINWEQRNFRFVEHEMWINWVAYVRDTLDKKSPELIGHYQATIHENQSSDQKYTCQLGWMLASHYHHRGITTRLVKEMIQQLRISFPDITFQAYIHKDNQASQRIAQKVGMHYLSWNGMDEIWVLAGEE